MRRGHVKGEKPKTKSRSGGRRAKRDARGQKRERRAADEKELRSKAESQEARRREKESRSRGIENRDRHQFPGHPYTMCQVLVQVREPRRCSRPLQTPTLRSSGPRRTRLSRRCQYRPHDTWHSLIPANCRLLLVHSRSRWTISFQSQRWSDSASVSGEFLT